MEKARGRRYRETVCLKWEAYSAGSSYSVWPAAGQDHAAEYLEGGLRDEDEPEEGDEEEAAEEHEEGRDLAAARAINRSACSCKSSRHSTCERA